MATVKILCDLCGEHIANADIRNLAMPIRGYMFDSPDPDHGFPDPFIEDDVDWVWMRCPYGRTHRPFLVEGEFTTDRGKYVIGKGFVDEMEDPDAENIDAKLLALNAKGLKPSEIGKEVGLPYQAVMSRLKTLEAT